MEKFDGRGAGEKKIGRRHINENKSQCQTAGGAF